MNQLTNIRRRTIKVIPKIVKLNLTVAKVSILDIIFSDMNDLPAYDGVKLDYIVLCELYHKMFLSNGYWEKSKIKLKTSEAIALRRFIPTIPVPDSYFIDVNEMISELDQQLNIK
jgi:hypothetical protein